MSKQPADVPDSSLSGSRRLALMGRVGLAVRDMQSATNQVDEAVRKRLGVNATDLALLGVIDRYGPLMATELSRALGITPPSTTVALDRLTAAGHLRRERDPADARRVRVVMSPATKAFLAAAYQPLRHGGMAYLEGRSDAELETLAAFLEYARQMQQDQAARIAEMPMEEETPRVSR